MRIASIIFPKWFLCVLLLAPVLSEGRARFSWDDHQIIDKKWPEASETSTGLRYLILEEGKGPRPKPGDRVTVLYKGMFLNGEIFDKALDPEKPFVFRLGRGEVIRGWEEGIARMRVGERQILIVPAELAYGTRGRPPGIPRSTALLFEVEMIKIEPIQ